MAETKLPAVEMVRWLDLGGLKKWSQVMDSTWDLREERGVDAGLWVWRLSIWVVGEDRGRR